jgi:hypothetical protein
MLPMHTKSTRTREEGTVSDGDSTLSQQQGATPDPEGWTMSNFRLDCLNTYRALEMIDIEGLDDRIHGALKCQSLTGPASGA